MSKIVVLMGSPRKGGNTDTLVKSFCDGAKFNNEVEIIRVCDYKINPCIGCNACFLSEHKCVQRDDMTKVFDVLSDAEVLVIASPVYFYGVSAQLKSVIDRFHNPKRNDLKLKKLALLLVGASSLEKVFDSILVQYQLVLDFFNLLDGGKVLVRNVSKIGDIANNSALNEAFALGQLIGKENA